MNIQIIVDDKYMQSEDFFKLVAKEMAIQLLELKRSPSDIISQRKAFAEFGKGNVLRWRRTGRLEVFAKRPGKVEYKRSDLLKLQHCQQDYFQ